MSAETIAITIAFALACAGIIAFYETRRRSDMRKARAEGYLEGTKATILHEQRARRPFKCKDTGAWNTERSGAPSASADRSAGGRAK